MIHGARRRIRLAAVCLAAAVMARPACAAVITVVNDDGAGEGFNDPTPVAPVGGNAGTTRGMQRLIAFQYAAGRWAAVLSSPVEIRVAARFDPMPCTDSYAVLGGAGPESEFRDFAGAPVPNTWYHVALANSLAGVDLDPGVDDIDAIFNSTYGAGCAFPSSFYYGLDGNAGGSQTDFVSVVLHELGHGLGFSTFVDDTTGAKYFGRDDAFMRNLEDHSTGKHYPEMSNAERATANTDTGDLYWTGATVVAGSTFLTTGGHVDGVEMYAPNPVQLGSSVSHFSNALSPDELMEPAYTGPNHDLTLATALFVDIGWRIVQCGDGVVQFPEGCDDGGTTSGDGCSSACRVESCFACTGTPSVCSPAGDGTSCDDGDACTQTDVCLGGVCSGTNPVVCTPLDLCHDAGTCDQTTGQCSSPARPEGALCDDGDGCTGPDTCHDGTCLGLPSCVGHFLCYRARTTAGTAKFVPVAGFSLADAFDPLTVDVIKPHHLCTPADKDGGGTVDAATHLEDYVFKPVTGSLKPVRRTNLRVVNEVGTLTVDTVKPATLLVPVAEDATVDLPAPSFASHEVDHYECYKIRVTPRTPRFLPVAISVGDEFTSPAKLLALKKPAFLCTPVNAGGSGTKHGAIHQLCYKVKPAAGQPRATARLGLHVSGEFGHERLNTRSEDVFCIASLVDP